MSKQEKNVPGQKPGQHSQQGAPKQGQQQNPRAPQNPQKQGQPGQNPQKQGQPFRERNPKEENSSQEYNPRQGQGHHGH